MKFQEKKSDQKSKKKYNPPRIIKLAVNNTESGALSLDKENSFYHPS